MASRDERWEMRHGQHEQVREVFQEPYAKAVAPVVAGVLGFQGRAKVRVLVIGGGKGRFSHQLLPRIREELARQGCKQDVDVVESDISSVISHAPGKRLRADAGKLPFKEKTFDLVMGESMIHQDGPQGLRKWFKEASRVLRPTGAFVHVQDFTPDPRMWAPQLAQGLSEERPTMPTMVSGPGDKWLMDLMGVMAHSNVLHELDRSAQREGMGLLSLDVGQQAIVPEVKRVAGGSRPLDLGTANRWELRMGGLSGLQDRDVPKGKTKLIYVGQMAIAPKQAKDVPALMEHLRKIHGR